MKPIDYKKKFEGLQRLHIGIMRDDVGRYVSLCEAAGVDPATLEDGIEMLWSRIAATRAENDRLRKALAEACAAAAAATAAERSRIVAMMREVILRNVELAATDRRHVVTVAALAVLADRIERGEG